MTELTYERVAELLHYDPETGELTRKKNTGRARAGDKAGTRMTNGWGYNTYLALKVDHKTYYAHRIAYLLMTGQWPDGHIDHRNGDSTDNRWNNLREVTASENHRNRRVDSRNTSGFRGVYWMKDRHKWQVRIEANQITYFCGYFDTLEGAILERLEAEATYWGYHPENAGA